MCKHHLRDPIGYGFAAPMFELERFHVLDEDGHPACVPIDHCPIHGIDLSEKVRREDVPDSHRCHRRGCRDLWHPYPEGP
jgi:hypothetical protein